MIKNVIKNLVKVRNKITITRHDDQSCYWNLIFSLEKDTNYYSSYNRFIGEDFLGEINLIKIDLTCLGSKLTICLWYSIKTYQVYFDKSNIKGTSPPL